jgi:ABC-type transport system involved in multi-copper enzyme maturation permease subunit
MLGFGTIAGERESGSLALLMAQPVRRSNILLGKWLGLFGVLATAVLLGFGLGGLFVLLRTDALAGDYGTLALFILETLAWGAAWISVTVFLSSWFNRRGTAIAGSIGAWFFFSTLIWTLLTAIVVVLVFRSSVTAGVHAPRWLVVTQWLNPNTAYEGLATATIPGFTSVVAASTRALLGDVFQPLSFGIALAAWVVVPFWGAYALFERKDA